MQIFISLFDFFIQRLVLDLELLEVNQMQALSQFLLLLEYLLVLDQCISQTEDVQAQLLQYFALFDFLLLPVLDLFLADGLVISAVLRFSGHLLLQFHKRSLDISALLLFFIQFCLELFCHLVIPVLRVF